MIKSEEYAELLEKLFNHADNALKIDLAVLRQICSSQDYRRLIDVTSILFKLFLAGRQHLSIRDLVGQSLYPSLADRHRPQAEKQSKIDFFVDGLSAEELTVMIKELQKVRRKLKSTIYSIKLSQIMEMLMKGLSQIRSQSDRKDELPLLGDVQIMEQEYRKYLAGSIFQSNPQPKLSEFLKNPKPYLQAKFTNTATLLKFIAVEILPHLEKSVLSIPLINHTQREGQLSRILSFIHNYFIVQYQIEIEISKNTLVQTRIYSNKFQRELLFRYRKMVIRAVRKILNEAILCPSSMNIQIMLLRILRRLYFLWDYSNANSAEHLENIREFHQQDDSSINNIVRNPLFLVLRNIALFSEGREEELKEAAMLTYKTIQDKNDIEFVNLLENCEELRFLKASKFYSSKAYAFADEVQKIYEPLDLGNLYLKHYQNIPARQIWVYTFLIEKPSSLISWEFHLSGYDIKFGIFKTQDMREMTLQQYEKGVDCRQVSKLQKIQNTSSSPNRGHLYLKNGVYRLVFDNSFSMMRSKEIFYTFLHLESSS